MLPRGLSAALACLLVGSASSANADVIYQYRGPDFTSATSPYTTSDFVSASFQLPAALGGNLTGVTVCPVSEAACTAPYSVSDGVDTLTNANSTIQFFRISTNAEGIPTTWSLSASNLFP